WGVFPSISGSWVVSEESFFPQTNFLSLAKVRASWGVTGNNSIGNYTQYALVGLGYNAIFGSNVLAGSRVENLGNSELGWETTSQIDIGVDIGLFKNRVNLIYDYYNKVTTDLLYSFDIPQSSGYGSFTGNTGEFNFWGHEISIQSRNLVGEFRWTTDLMLTFADNKVVSLADNVEELIRGGHITRVGERIGLFWGLEKIGLYMDQEDYDSSPKAGPSAVGTIKFRDVNGDGVITNSNTGDRTIIGDPTPKFLFGMTNTFSYKNFDLSIVMAGSYGNDIANRYDQGTTNLDGVFNIKKEIKDRWRSPENPGSGKYGTTSTGTFMERDWFNSRFIEDGSYISIKNLTLGYSFNMGNVNWLSNIRLYGSIQQLATFTKYSGNNPEVSQSTNILQLGDDNAMYPIPRTFTIGINVDF
ncbi:MAG: SusC/RagA family TonB-linked outer membrane protein, partial [Bacteroidales bacterium]